MKKQDAQKAMTIFMLAKSLIDSKDENLEGKALAKIKSIEHKLHMTLFAKSMLYKDMAITSSEILSNASKNISAENHSPLMVGLHVLGDNRKFLGSVSGFNMNFDEIDSLCENIVDESNITLDEVKECSKLAAEFQKYI